MTNTIEIWKAKIKSEIPGHVWPHSDFDVRKHFYDWPNTRFFFYYYFSLDNTEIQNPIIANQIPSKEIRIHPGLNRFIGTSFRNESVWLDALIYIQSPKISNPNIEWIEVVDKFSSKKSAWEISDHDSKLKFNKFTQKQENEIKQIIIEHSQNARIEIINEFGKMLVFNRTGIWTLTKHIEEHGGVHSTLKSIYDHIKILKKQAE